MSALYLDLHLEIDIAEQLRTKLYNKREDFNFPIVNFPFRCSNIPEAPGYGEYISQLIRYSRDCGTYEDFLDKRLLLTRKLLNQGFLLVKLKLSLRQFYGRHHGLVGRYWIYVSLVEHLRSPPYFGGVRVTRSLVLYVCFVDRWLSFCTFFFWPLCCLFFCGIRILITSLVSSNSSYNNNVPYYKFSDCISSLTQIKNKRLSVV